MAADLVKCQGHVQRPRPTRLQVSPPPVSVLGAASASRLGCLPASLGDLSGPALCALPSPSEAPVLLRPPPSSRTGLPGLAMRPCVSDALRPSPGPPVFRILFSVPSRAHALLPRGILIAPFWPVWTQCPQPHVAVHSPPSRPLPFTAFQPLLLRASSQGASFGNEEPVGRGGAVSARPRLQ